MNTTTTPRISLLKQPPGQSHSTRCAHPFITRKLIFGAARVSCLPPIMSPPLALLLGLLMAQFVGYPFRHLNGINRPSYIETTTDRRMTTERQ